jgi:hypothetical protein
MNFDVSLSAPLVPLEKRVIRLKRTVKSRGGLRIRIHRFYGTKEFCDAPWPSKELRILSAPKCPSEILYISSYSAIHTEGSTGLNAEHHFWNRVPLGRRHFPEGARFADLQPRA